jgi:hypothetical protein
MRIINNHLLLLVTGFILISSGVQGQFSPEIRKKEAELRVMADSIVLGRSDHTREGALAVFNSTFLDLLADPNTFNYPFDSIRPLSKVKSPDGRVRIYTWTIRSLKDGTYRYYGIVQHKETGNQKIRNTGLIEKKYENDSASVMTLLPGEWYGALYYDIVQKKVKKDTWYFLLGWHGNNAFTTRKIIDVLTIDQYNNLEFGARVFEDEKGKRILTRVIFEFSAEAVMLLRYDKKKKGIVFDHLSPSSPSAKGQYRYYGPDFTYDGYFFKKGMWRYKKNLDLRNEK